MRETGRLVDWFSFPFQTEPVQVFDGCFTEFRFTASRVEVFVAVEKDAALFTGALLSCPESASMAKVQQSGGRGGKAAAVHYQSIKRRVIPS